MLLRNLFQAFGPCVYRLKPTSSQCTRLSGVRFNGRYEWKDPNFPHDVVHVIFKVKDGTEIRVAGKVNDNLMYLARRHGIEIEGACEASLACSTCHVYVGDEMLAKLPEPKDEENDMLDLAPFLKTNSRLSCQIILTKELDGIVIELPPATRNFYVDGHKPEPH